MTASHHPEDVAAALATVVSDQRAAIVAALIRLTGDWELAEDSVQDAVERAMDRWPDEGTPRSPGAWLTTVARNRALDVLRRRANERAKLAEKAILDDASAHGGVPGDPLADDLLRLVFTCCHPALALESRVALTLKVVAGLSTAEVARSLLVSEATMSQRLLRAKRKIEHAGIPYRVPDGDQLAERTSAVLAVVYLVFNQGYGQADGRLALDAQRLAELVVTLMPDHDEARGLLALITLQNARRATRFDEHGELVPMDEQDRTRWDHTLLEQGRWQLRRAQASRRPPGPYRIQAHLAACHASGRDAGATPWPEIVRWYDALLVASPSPVVALNRAVAVGFRDGWAAGLAELDRLPAHSVDALSGYALLPATRADFLRRLGRRDEAHHAYAAAVHLSAEGSAERRFLQRRLTETR